MGSRRISPRHGDWTAAQSIELEDDAARVAPEGNLSCSLTLFLGNRDQDYKTPNLPSPLNICRGIPLPLPFIFTTIGGLNWTNKNILFKKRKMCREVRWLSELTQQVSETPGVELDSPCPMLSPHRMWDVLTIHPFPTGHFRAILGLLPYRLPQCFKSQDRRLSGTHHSLWFCKWTAQKAARIVFPFRRINICNNHYFPAKIDFCQRQGYSGVASQ